MDGAASEVGFNGPERGFGGRYGGLSRVHLGIGDLHVGLCDFHRAASAGEFLGADAAGVGYRLGEAQVALCCQQLGARAAGASRRDGLHRLARGHFALAFATGRFERTRVELEQRVTGLHLLAHLHADSLNDAWKMRGDGDVVRAGFYQADGGDAPPEIGARRGEGRLMAGRPRHEGGQGQDHVFHGIQLCCSM